MVQGRAPAFIADVMIDEILDAVLTLLRRRPARLLLTLDIVMREIGRQSVKISHGQASFRGFSQRLTRRAHSHSSVPVTKPGIDYTKDLADHPGLIGAVPRMALRRVLRRKGAKQIRTANNSDDAIVVHDRNSLDPIFLEEAGDFRSLGCFGNPDHRCGHDFSSGEVRVP